MPTEPFSEGNLSSEAVNRVIELIRENSSLEPESVFLRLLDECSAFSHEETRKKLFFIQKGFPEAFSLSQNDADFLNDAVRRVTEGEPVQYITGKTDFYGREFAVKPGVLIPRFDTETLVEKTLSLLPQNGRFADLCCGSGCIGITILAERNDSTGFFADISSTALEMTTKNAENHGVETRAEIKEADVLKPCNEGFFDLILSNPPYIPSAEIKALSKEVKNEPSLALDGGEDGLNFYRAILKNFKKT